MTLDTAARAQSLFEIQQRQGWVRTDRLFGRNVGNQGLAPDRDQVRRAGSGADEMDGHAASGS